MATYEEYKQKIRSYSRDDVLVQTSHLTWKAWKHESDTPEKDKKNKVLIQGYCPRVFAISAAVGNNFNRKTPGGTDVLRLCNSFLAVSDSVSDKAFISQEKEQLRELTRKAEFLGKFKLDLDAVEVASPAAFLLRTIRSQWDAQAYSMRHVVRSWMIWEELRKITGEKVSEVALQVLNQSAKDTFRSGIALFGMIHSREPGFGEAFLNIDKSNCEQNVTDKYEISLDTLKVIASRLATTLPNLRAWHDTVLEQPEVYKKYFPLPFYSTPLVAANDLNVPFDRDREDLLFVCPCPSMLLAGIASLVFRLIGENRELLSPRDILVDIGDAAEAYLGSVLPTIFEQSRITRVQDRSRRNADFIIDLDECYLVIECKRSIGNKTGRMIAAPEDQVLVWDKILDALLQCSSTISSNGYLKQSKKPILNIVVADATILGEEAIFALVAETSGILKAIGTEYFEVLSFDSFEKIFSSYEIKEIAELCLEKWNEFRKNPGLHSFATLNHAKFKSPKSTKNFRHIEKQFNTLLPKLDQLAKEEEQG